MRIVNPDFFITTAIGNLQGSKRLAIGEHSIVYEKLLSIGSRTTTAKTRQNRGFIAVCTFTFNKKNASPAGTLLAYFVVMEGNESLCPLCGRELAGPCNKHHLLPIS